MDQNKTDLVMQFTDGNGNRVWAECVLDVDPSADPLMTDFQSADYDYYSSFFEVMNFAMNVSVTPNDDASAKAAGHGRAAGPKTGNVGISQDFARLRSATTLQQARELAKHYPFEFGTLSFERLIDRASPVFFQACCSSTKFNKAVLVKRISQGGIANQSWRTLAYLRLEFIDVLITSIHWDDGDMVKERCEFICRGMSVQYRRQNADGTLGTPTEPVAWGKLGSSNGSR